MAELIGRKDVCFVLITVNVDIFACIDFRGFMKIGNFACIKICVLCIIGSLC